MPRLLRILLLVLLTCLPLVTLIHRDETGHWTRNREAMAAPDEPAYLLMAESLAAGQGLHTAPDRADRNAFYPPGLPLILAAWSRLVSPSIFSLHLCVALLLCATVPLVYLLTQRLLANPLSATPPPASFVPLLLTALYVTNWSTLETALFVFSEPAFLLVTFAWLLLALRWPTWYTRWQQALPIALLAIAAHLIRGAGLVCILATLAYPLLQFVAARYRRQAQASLAPILPAVALFAGYFALSYFLIPKAPNSYLSQLLDGLTDRGRLGWATPATFLYHCGHLAVLSGFDLLRSLIPWLRAEDLTHLEPHEARRVYTYLIVGSVLLVLAVTGYAFRLLRAGREGAGPASRFGELYVAGYTALYLLWPFHGFFRFWIPLLPLVLVYATLAIRELSVLPRLKPHMAWADRAPGWLAAALFGLLLALYAEELYLQLPYYQRRLNYVSDCLASSAATVRQLSPDPARTIVTVTGGDETFLYGYYFGRPVHSPTPEARMIDGRRRDERVEDLLLRQMAYVRGHPGTRLFLLDFFTHSPRTDDLIAAVVENLHREHPELLPPVAATNSPLAARGGTEPPTLPTQWQVLRRQQREIISAVWEFVPPADDQASR